MNGQTVALDVPAQLVSDRTMVPVRFISESLGASVDWDDATKTVIIKNLSQSGDTGADDPNSDVIYYEGFEGGKEGANLDAASGTSAANGAVPTYSSTAKTGSLGMKVVFRTLEDKTNLGCKLYVPESAQSSFKDGETYTISAYVYLVTPSSDSASFNIKTLNGKGSATVENGKPCEIKKGEWVQISNTFKYDKSKYTEGSVNIRIDTGKIEVGSYYFVDDVKVTKGADK